MEELLLKGRLNFAARSAGCGATSCNGCHTGQDSFVITMTELIARM
jgi:hypothetical protein